jgi:hypothetical protein
MRVTIELELDTGLTERAVEEMYANQFEGDVVSVEADN